MDVVSIGPLRVGSRVWQPRPSSWVLTVVVRATFDLVPDRARLSATQEPVVATDRFWDDDPSRSLLAPSDLAPFKPCADVVLVGSAHAPHQRAVTSLVARLAVGSVDKAVEVRADAPFTSMPLRHERAAGGPGTANPVGVPAGAGRPNLLLADPAQRADPLRSACFGPISPRWPERLEKLGRHADTWAHVSWYRQPLPPDMDRAYFNVAPRDQQLAALREDEALLLTHLHPEHEQLSTRLPGLRPRVFREQPGAALEDVIMVCDTLWIDADRGVATLAWRGRVMLQSATEAGRVLVALEQPGQPLTAADVASRAAEAASGARASAPLAQEATLTAPAQAGAGPIMPFAAPAARGAPEPAPAQGPIPGSPWAHAPPVAASAAPGSPSPWATGRPAPVSSPVAAAPPPPEPATVTGVAAPAASPRPAGSAGRGAGSARVVPAEILDLLFLEPSAGARVRKNRAWQSILDALEDEPADEDLDAVDAGEDEAPAEEDRRDVFQILAHAGTLDALGIHEARLRAVRPDGKFVPPLVLATGELELPFDELESVKALIALVTPLAGTDKRLKDAIDAAAEVVQTPGLEGTTGVFAAFGARIKEAYGAAGRALSAAQLDTACERLLLEKRRYQKRAVFNGVALRGLLSVGGAEPIPTYLPEEVDKQLPLFRRFRARILAEVHLPQDQHEAHPESLRVLALARAQGLGGP